MRRLRRWLEETHSAFFELCRHFFQQFFESEFVSAPGQLKIVAAGVLAVVASFGLIFAQSYYHKYRLLKALDDPQPFYRALTADVLFVIAMTMLLMGIFTTFQWPSLFPGLRDYLALASLPLRMWQIFAAKLAALVLFAGAAILAMVLPAAVGLTSLMPPTMFWHLPGIFVAAAAGCLFTFFALVALQGVLLNVLPARQFQRFLLAIQAALLAGWLGAAPFVISIPNLAPRMAERPEWAVWVPPLWFLGLDQVIFGNHEAMAARLAGIAWRAVGLSAAAALLGYAWSYRRQRVRVLESPARGSRSVRAWPSAVAARLIPDARVLGSFAFIAKTMARSRQHRLILTAMAGLALALIVEGFLELRLRGTFDLAAARRPVALAVPLTLSLFTLAGYRYLFRLPVELRANWIFRIHEPGRAREMLAGAERFLIFAGVIPVAVLTLPAEVYFLGPGTGARAALLCAGPALCLVEVLLFAFSRMPFTSSYLPGRRPMFEVVLAYGVAVALYVSLLSAVLGLCVESGTGTAATLGLFLISWWKLRAARLDMQQVTPLEFEEQQEPVVQTLAIERD